MFDQAWQNILALGLFGIILVFTFAFFLYFAPWFIASIRHKRQVNAIFFLNLFAGWTFIGWLVAFIWAAIREDSDGSE